jgi:glucokinase
MIIGIDLGGTNARAGLVENGRILETCQVKLSHQDSEESTLQQLYSTITPLLQPGIKGIGIGVPSIVDSEQGIVYDVVNIPSWKEVPLKDILEKKFGLPVFINNDVNCLALGEQLYGEAGEFASFVAVGIGTGMGAAIVIDHKLYNGLNCGSGEIGYIPYLDKNLEFYASGMYFESISTTAKDSYLAALNGDPAAMETWAAYGKHLGQVMKIIMYTYAPEAIIIGGGISTAFRFFETAMLKSMDDFIFPKTRQQVRILPSCVEHIAIMGAAALVASRPYYQVASGFLQI